MRGPILREQFLDGATGECAGWDKGEPKERGNHHAERETAQEQL